jgi:hypothetical protein
MPREGQRALASSATRLTNEFLFCHFASRFV